MGEDLRPAFRRSSVWPAAAVLALVALNAPVKWPTDFPEEAFPTAMVRQNAELFSESGGL